MGVGGGHSFLFGGGGRTNLVLFISLHDGCEDRKTAVLAGPAAEFTQ